MNQSKSTILIFIVIFLFSAFLYLPSLNYYFFQDDWFVLNWIRTKDWISFFSFRTDIIYWRPISMPIFFKIGYILFNLKPFGYHLIIFIFHLLNIILVYLLFRTLKISKALSLLVSFLFATAAFQFVSLSWLSTSSYVIGPAFILSTMIAFLNKKFIWAFLFFCLGLASTELILSVIPILFVISKVKIGKSVKNLFPYIILAIIYLIIRFFIFPLPKSGQYELKFTAQILTNFFWYFVWIFNVPEKMATILFFSNLKASLAAIIQFFQYLIFPLMLITAFFILISRSKIKKTVIIKGLIWFVVGILPVIFLPHHVYPMYLVVSSLGIFYILAKSLEKFKNYTFIIFAFSIAWFFSAYKTLSFTQVNHWIRNEQAISKAYTIYVKDKIKNPKSETGFLFKPADLSFSVKNNFTIKDKKEIFQSLNDQSSLQVIYNDSSIRSFYANHLEPIIIPSDINVLEISPSLK